MQGCWISQAHFLIFLCSKLQQKFTVPFIFRWNHRHWCFVFYLLFNDTVVFHTWSYVQWGKEVPIAFGFRDADLKKKKPMPFQRIVGDFFAFLFSICHKIPATRRDQVRFFFHGCVNMVAKNLRDRISNLLFRGMLPVHFWAFSDSKPR